MRNKRYFSIQTAAVAFTLLLLSFLPACSDENGGNAGHTRRQAIHPDHPPTALRQPYPDNKGGDEGRGGRERLRLRTQTGTLVAARLRHTSGHAAGRA